MKAKFILPALLLLNIFSALAQQTECATEVVHEKLMHNDIAYKMQILSLESRLDSLLQIQNIARPSSAIYTIPIVVHVIHLGEAVGTGSNISDAQIADAITGLNNRWRNIIGSSVDMEIEFCLASRDPNGHATTGINRINGSGIAKYSSEGITVPGCSSGAVENDVKALSRWPVSSYYNIWVVNKICNGQWGGWSYYPNGGLNDGTVILSTLMKSTSSILAHEVGHGFFLYHTFEGDGGNTSCPINNSCTTNGDLICDTPPQKQSDCGATDVCTGTGTWDNTRYNYMSYCSGLNRFTQGQKDRVRAIAIIAPRASLLSSLGCAAITGITYPDNGRIAVFPNPGNGKFHLDNIGADGTVYIYNMLGVIVPATVSSTGATLDIDLSAQPKGIYFMLLTQNGRTYCKELILQ